MKLRSEAEIRQTIIDLARFGRDCSPPDGSADRADMYVVGFMSGLAWAIQEKGLMAKLKPNPCDVVSEATRYAKSLAAGRN